MRQLPVKFRVFQIISQLEDVSNIDLYKILKNEYPHDRHVTPQGVDSYLMSLKAVGLIRPTFAQLSDGGNIILKYQLTTDGESKLKYVDSGHKNNSLLKTAQHS